MQQQLHETGKKKLVIQNFCLPYNIFLCMESGKKTIDHTTPRNTDHIDDNNTNKNGPYTIRGQITQHPTPRTMGHIDDNKRRLDYREHATQRTTPTAVGQNDENNTKTEKDRRLTVVSLVCCVGWCLVGYGNFLCYCHQCDTFIYFIYLHIYLFP